MFGISSHIAHTAWVAKIYGVLIGTENHFTDVTMNLALVIVTLLGNGKRAAIILLICASTELFLGDTL